MIEPIIVSISAGPALDRHLRLSHLSVGEDNRVRDVEALPAEKPVMSPWQRMP